MRIIDEDRFKNTTTSPLPLPSSFAINSHVQGKALIGTIKQAEGNNKENMTEWMDRFLNGILPWRGAHSSQSADTS
jgi:hypothetical protein